jgi:hypothetical protein
VLRAGAEEEVRVAGEVLVEGIARAHEHPDRGALAAPGAAETLLGARDRARVRVQDAHVQGADVHAQLQRRGRNDAVEAARAELRFLVAPLGRQVAAAIGGNSRGLARIAVVDVFQVLGQHLDFQTRVREDDGLESHPDRQARDARRLRARGGANPEVGVDHRRVPDEQVLAAAGRAGLGHRGDRAAQEFLGELGGVRDRGRAEDEGRARLVEPADALQPPDEVRHVRAEHAAVGVQLVDDHEPQRLEELRPLGVMGQDALVEHVRIGDDDVALGAHRLARIARRVAVEGAGANAEVARRVELEDLRDLVLRERLGGKEIERFRAALEGGVDDRQVVAERLARGGRRDHHGVAPGGDMVPRLALMAVQVENAALPQRPGEPWVEAGGEVGVPRVARRDDDLAGNPGALVALELVDQGFGAARRRPQPRARVSRRVEEIQRAFEEPAHAHPPRVWHEVKDAGDSGSPGEPAAAVRREGPA